MSIPWTLYYANKAGFVNSDVCLPDFLCEKAANMMHGFFTTDHTDHFQIVSAGLEKFGLKQYILHVFQQDSLIFFFQQPASNTKSEYYWFTILEDKCVFTPCKNPAAVAVLPNQTKLSVFSATMSKYGCLHIIDWARVSDTTFMFQVGKRPLKLLRYELYVKDHFGVIAPTFPLSLMNLVQDCAPKAFHTASIDPECIIGRAFENADIRQIRFSHFISGQMIVFIGAQAAVKACHVKIIVDGKMIRFVQEQPGDFIIGVGEYLFDKISKILKEDNRVVDWARYNPADPGCFPLLLA